MLSDAFEILEKAIEGCCTPLFFLDVSFLGRTWDVISLPDPSLPPSLLPSFLTAILNSASSSTPPFSSTFSRFKHGRYCQAQGPR